MKSLKHYRQVIQRVCPDLAIASIELNSIGQNNDVAIVNNSLVFRVPKYPLGIQNLTREIAILKGIKNYITLEIPQPIFINLSQPIGKAFVGYHLIPGEPLWQKTVKSIANSATLNTLAAQLGKFLHELHRIPVATAIAYPLSARDTAAEWTNIFTRIQLKLFPYMKNQARSQVVRDFETFLYQLQQWTYIPSLKHGDFGTTNILFDPETFTIRGIIDFGNAGLGDPAYDVAGLFSYGERFVYRLARAYPKIETLWERAKFYNQTFALLEALFGVENGDRQAFAKGIAAYR